MLWRPEVSSLVLPVRGDSSDSAQGLDVLALRCRTVILAGAGRTEHVLFSESACRLQLLVRGASVLARVRLLADAVVGIGDIERRLDLLRRLMDLAATHELRPRLYPSAARASRFRVVLRALDAWLAGASQREIAIAIVGPRRVEADWGDPGDHLRDRIRRAVRRGRTLMERGYLALLR